MKKLAILLIILISNLLFFDIVYKIFYFNKIYPNIDFEFDMLKDVPTTFEDIKITESKEKKIIYSNDPIEINVKDEDYEKVDAIYCRKDKEIKSVCFWPSINFNYYQIYNNASSIEAIKALYFIKPSILFKMHNINNNKDLFLEALKNTKKKINYLNSPIDIQYFTMMRNFALNTNFEGYNKLYTISGDYDGHFSIIDNEENNTIYIIEVCRENKFRCASLSIFDKYGNYFTKEKIIDFISSIEI